MDERRAAKVAAKAAWLAAQTPEKQAELAARATLRNELRYDHLGRQDKMRAGIEQFRKEGK